MFSSVFNPWSTLTHAWNALPVQAATRSRFSYGFHEEEAGALHYRLFIPHGGRAGPMPLVVMLHGCGQDGADFAAGTGMNDLAEEQGFLVLYPEQSCSAHWNRCWNWYEGTPHRGGAGEPALLAGLTRRVIAEHAVDPARVAVAGLSAGGAMAVILGRTYPGLFSAVGCHSGLAHGSARCHASAMLAMRHGPDPAAPAPPAPRAAVPVIAFHGDADGTVHQTNGSAVIRQSLDSHGLQVDAGVATVAEAGRAGGRCFTRHVHREPTGEVLAEHWIVHGAGHAWSGGDLRGSHADERGPNASAEMLRFFFGRAPA